MARPTTPDASLRSADVLVVRGLRKTYETDGQPVRALRGVDLAVGAGEFVAIMGPSGSGKSTLLNLVAGLDRPDDGEIVLGGLLTTNMRDNEVARLRRRHIGMVFQFFHLLDDLDAMENVSLPAVVAGSSRKVAEARARELLDLLGLSDRARDAPRLLSGGQRQRLAIARSLANNPTLLLADEPTGSLDSSGGHEVMELLRRLHGGGQTIVVVTHDKEVAVAAARVLHMRDGRLVEAGPDGAGGGHSVPDQRPPGFGAGASCDRR
jgi:putative ABC transport system ATP-binding protein